MKNILIIFCILLFIPFVSPVKIEMKSNYSQGETLIANFSGNFVSSINEKNILFYRGHVRVPIEPHITKIEGTYYIYAILPEKNANYSVRIENTKYLEGKKIIEKTIIKNFTITNKTADFSAEPGFVITPNKFDLILQNLQESEILVKLKIESSDSSEFYSPVFGRFNNEENKSFILKPGEEKKVSFELKNITKDSLKTIILSTTDTSYRIPLYALFHSATNKKQWAMRFSENKLKIIIPTRKNLTKIITLKNIGYNQLQNITLSKSDSLEPYLKIPISEINLSINENERIGLYFVASADEKVIKGQIKAKTNQTYAYIPVTLIYINNYNLTNEDNATTIIITCNEMGGVLCADSSNCDGKIDYAEDGICCLGKCEQNKNSSNNNKLIGWGIVIVLVGIIGWFFTKKYKGVKKKFPAVLSREIKRTK